MLFVITGASGSGKSEYAERLVCGLAERDGIEKKWYVATMQSGGAEAAERIARHRKLRAGRGFATVEAPFGLSDQSMPSDIAGACVLLECTSNLLANLMFSAGLSGEAAQEEGYRQIRAAAGKCRHLVVVTNEIFSDGIVYAGELEQYIAALGRLNVRLAGAADCFCEVVYTIPVFLKGEEACLF